MMDRTAAMSPSCARPAAARTVPRARLRRFVSDHDGSDAVVRADASWPAIARVAPFTERTQQ